MKYGDPARRAMNDEVAECGVVGCLSHRAYRGDGHGAAYDCEGDITRREPLDVNRIAGYMSPGAAQGVFGQRLSDVPPGLPHRTDHSQMPPQWEVEAHRQRQLDNAWDDLEHAKDFEQQRDAVMELTELTMGADTSDRWRTTSDRRRTISVEFTEDGDIETLAALTAVPPITLGTTMSNLHFYGVVSDPDSPEMQTATLEFTQPESPDEH